MFSWLIIPDQEAIGEVQDTEQGTRGAQRLGAGFHLRADCIRAGRLRHTADCESPRRHQRCDHGHPRTVDTVTALHLCAASHPVWGGGGQEHGRPARTASGVGQTHHGRAVAADGGQSAQHSSERRRGRPRVSERRHDCGHGEDEAMGRRRRSSHRSCSDHAGHPRRRHSPPALCRHRPRGALRPGCLRAALAVHV